MTRSSVRNTLMAAAASALLSLVTACAPPTAEGGGTPAENTEATGGAPHVAADSDADRAGIAAGFHKGMAYGTFRARLVGQGWDPVANPDCRANLLGAEAAALCAANPALLNCGICNTLPELQACSGDARCLVRFQHAETGQVLEARAYGELAYWDETDDDAGLQVTDWVFAAPSGR